MLRDYTELAASLTEKFKSIKVWPEIEFNSRDKERLRELGNVTFVNNHSFQLQIEGNHCVIPGQYILYAVCIKELALAVKEHLDLYDRAKAGKSSDEIAEMITTKSYDKNIINSDIYSEELALKIFDTPGLNQEAKSIINKRRNGEITIRSTTDYYGSIILKPINVPAASSGILGKLIYNLAGKTALYSYLQERFIAQIPSYITKDKNTNGFVKKVLSFLLDYDGLARIETAFSRNLEPGLMSMKDGNITLTSIFKLSRTLLTENDLKYGDKPRYFKDPLYINEENEFVYLSTEWTNGKESRLDLDSFKKLIEQYYPEFNITFEGDIHYLRCNSKENFNFVITDNKEFDLKQLNADIKNSGLKIDERLAVRLASSLLTKPFVILTGLSGSGKTKLAQAFATWICEFENQYCIIPVGADWTNREPLLGFPNALVAEAYVKPDNGVLDLLINANQYPEKPFFLILDEMNLSHVERYFADFLSVMESKGSVTLHNGQDWNGIPGKLGLPPNLFIIGTVNIDETTYMFSPKVLDRANVIEFRVAYDEMESFLKSIAEVDLKKLKSLGSEMADSFVSLASDNKLVAKDGEVLQSNLLSFFIELKKTGAEFGYRSASEIVRFAAVVNKIEPNWTTLEIIDAAIMQKLLPKVHGSRRKLEPVLKSLGKLCLLNETKLDEYLKDTTEPDYSQAKYPVSFEKIRRMYLNLTANGFTSYAEA